MGESSQRSECIDVLIITALPDELAGLKSIEDGARGPWEERQDSAGFSYHVREFAHASGGVLRVAAARPVAMGESSATGVATRLVKQLEPRCLAMSGICAGRRGEVALGDVIVANRLFNADAGKLKAWVDADGARSEELFHEVTTYNLDPRWEMRAQDWPPDALAGWRERWQGERPRTLTAQGDWLLDQLYRYERGEGEPPHKHPELATYCAARRDVIVRLRERGMLTQDDLALTDEGREYVEKLRLLDVDGPGGQAGTQDEAPLRVHVAPMATVSSVKQDPELFGRLLKIQRKCLGVDMESAAIGLVAALEQVPRTLVVKAVQDYADHDKDDSMRVFGARVAAAFVLDFLRVNMPVDEAPPPALRERLSSGQRELPARMPPAAYLVARYQVVPFVGRETELATLDRWADSDDAVRVLLIHGPGGMGKTRLLTQWLAERRQRQPADEIGFLAGELDEATVDAVCANQRALIAIDYAEERVGLEALLSRVSALAGEEQVSDRRLRIVLLARNAGDWWASLQGRSDDMRALLCEPPLALAPLTDATQAARSDEYRRVHAAFVDALQGHAAGHALATDIVTELREIPDLAGQHFERPLYLHMAALNAALGKPPGGVPREIVDAVIEHEQRYWASYLGLSPTEREWRRRVEGDARQVAAAMVARGSCARDDLPAVMDALGISDAGCIVELMQDLYPAPELARARAWVVSIEPDLVAEALLCGVIERMGHPEAWLAKVLTGIEPRRWAHVFTVLGRMGVGHDDGMGEVGANAARALLGDDVSGRAEAAFEAALALTEHTAHSSLGQILADALSGVEYVAIVRALDGRVPKVTVSLRELSVRVYEILLAGLDDGDDGAERARLNNNLGVRYSELGKQEESLLATERAVKEYEELASKRPDAFLPDLAMSLNNLGNRYSELGKREEALLATERAVKEYEELASKRPDAFLPGLAMSLSSLGNRYSELGKREEALQATERAAKLHEELASERPDAFLPGLVMSLNNLGIRYNELGKWEEALWVTERAVKEYEELALRRPDAFLPNLAKSLNNLGVRYCTLGKREEALWATERAAKLDEELASKRPDAFLPNLAISLNNLGIRYSELEKGEEALWATERAVNLREELALKWPDAFLPDLATSLATRSMIHHDVGDIDRALQDIVAAIGHLWPYFERLPAAFSILMGAMLQHYVRYLDGAQPEEAMAERIRLYEELVPGE